MKTWKAKVRINGRTVDVQVTANYQWDARAILESQYGKANVVTLPTEVR